MKLRPRFHLFGAAQSRAFRCMWVLAELHLDYEWTEISFQKNEHRSEFFQKLNPGKKVPVLVVDEQWALSESLAICNFLAREVTEPRLIPKASLEDHGRALALYEQWCFFIVTELEQAIWTWAKAKFALPQEMRVPEIKKAVDFEWQRNSHLVDQQLASQPAGNFLLGSHFTVADILLGQTLLWAQRFNFPLTVTQDEYVNRLQARPGFQAAKIRAEQASAK